MSINIMVPSTCFESFGLIFFLMILMVLFIISFENLGSQYCLCIILLSGCCVCLPLLCVYYSSLAFSFCAYKLDLPHQQDGKSSLTSSDLFPSVEVASSGAIVAVISKSPQSSVVVSRSSLTPPFLEFDWVLGTSDGKIRETVNLFETLCQKLVHKLHSLISWFTSAGNSG